MKKFYLLIAAAILVASCKKEHQEPETETSDVRIMGTSVQTGAEAHLPTLWTDKRQTDFISTATNTHYYMHFMRQIGGKWFYFGVEDSFQSTGKIGMWSDGNKKVLSAETNYSPPHEELYSYSVAANNDIYILAANLSVDGRYYYKIANNGTVITRHILDVDPQETVVHVEAEGGNLYYVTTGIKPATDIEDTKAIFRLYKNNTLLNTHFIVTENEEYMDNYLQLGSVHLVDEILYILGRTNASNEYYFLKLTRNTAETKQGKLDVGDYSLNHAFGYGNVHFENNKFYVPANKDEQGAYFIVDIQSGTAAIQKVDLPGISGFTSVLPARVHKLGNDIYISGSADNFGVYWKNGQMIMPDKSGMYLTEIVDIQAQ